MEEDDEIVFESPEKEKNQPPLFENEDHGVTVWAEEDKNGDIFLRLKLPLGLGTIPLFVNDAGYENIRDSVNKLVDHLNEE